MCGNYLQLALHVIHLKHNGFSFLHFLIQQTQLVSEVGLQGHTEELHTVSDPQQVRLSPHMPTNCITPKGLID